MSLASNFIVARLSFLSLALVGCNGASTHPNPSSGSGDAKPPVDTGPTADVGPPPNIDDPVEPVWQPDQVGARVKSPNQQMHFTAGLPFRILADGNDPKAYQ